MTVEATIQRALSAIEEGRLWRAKEILSSSIPQYGYSTELYRAYADLLFKMGDELQAGRYYLLSIDEPSVAQANAMELFLSRHRKSGWRQMLSQFPPAARLSHRDEYPKVLRERLVLWQAPEILVDPRTFGPQRPGRLARLLPLGCIVASMGIAVCALIGVYTLLSWIT
jgi:hypothetical protein